MRASAKKRLLDKYIEGLRWTVASPAGEWADLSMAEACRISFRERLIWGAYTLTADPPATPEAAIRQVEKMPGVKARVTR